MLLIRLTTTKILTLKQEQLIKERITRIIQGKVMIHIEDNQVIYLDNEELECIFIECLNDSELFDQVLLEQLKQEIEKITGIPSQNQYYAVQTYQFFNENV
jgi:hypothetical protein